MATSDESRLLSLPMELLTRITDMLNDESLSTLRLTCKTLEGVAFKRFTKTFAVSYCCMYYEARWLSLKKFLRGSPRLVRNLKCIDFTTNPLERHHYTEMQLAPGEEFHDILGAQEQFDMREANEEELFEPLYADRQASRNLIHSVFLDLSELAPYASIGFDLTHTRFFREEDIVLHRDIFLAIASFSCPLSELVLSRHCLDDIEDLKAHLGDRLLSCTSCLHSFTFKSVHFLDVEFGDSLDESKLEFLASILRSAESLFCLNLELDEYRLSVDPWAITKKLLFANTLTFLEQLSLHATSVPEKQLLKVIASCKTSLNILNLGGVRLLDSGDGWATIFQSLMKLSRLDFLRLSCLTTSGAIGVASVSELDFHNVKHWDKVTNTHIVFNTRRKVAAGLQDLTSGPLLYTERLSGHVD